MTEIQKTDNGLIVCSEGKQIGTFAKVEKVAEGSNFYRLYRRNHSVVSFLLNAATGKTIFVPTIDGSQDVFHRVEAYSGDSKSVVVFPFDGEDVCHLIYEDGERRGPFLYVGEENKASRAVRFLNGMWIFFDTVKRTYKWNKTQAYSLGENRGLHKQLAEGFYSEFVLNDEGERSYRLCRYLKERNYHKGHGYSYETKFTDIYTEPAYLIGIAGGKFHIFYPKADTSTNPPCSPVYISDIKPKSCGRNLIAHDEEGFALLCRCTDKRKFVHKCLTNTAWQSDALSVIDEFICYTSEEEIKLYDITEANSEGNVPLVMLPNGWHIQKVNGSIFSVLTANGERQMTAKELKQCSREYLKEAAAMWFT